MRKLIFIIILFASVFNAVAQSYSANFTAKEYNIDSLNIIYGKHKHLLKEYELVSLIALSYFPELSNERINFKLSDINSTAKTTLTFGSIFKKINKQYIIYINDDIKRTGMLLNQASLDAQVGLIAHELAHVTDFKSKSFLNLVWWAIKYTVAKQQPEIEKRADKITIRCGLGWPLYHWADFVLNHSTANKQYLKMKQTKYLLPDEILRYMKKYKNTHL